MEFKLKSLKIRTEQQKSWDWHLDHREEASALVHVFIVLTESTPKGVKT